MEKTPQSVRQASQDLISPQGEKRLVTVYKKAVQNKPILDALLTLVAKQTGARAISNLKDPKTTITKTVEKRLEDPSRHYELEDVNDIARGRLVYNSLKEVYNAITVFKKDIKGAKVRIIKEEDFFKHPNEGGYHGYNIDLVFPNGQHSEIQFHTPNSYAATLATHNLHEDDTTTADQKSKVLAGKIMNTSEKKANLISSLVEHANQPIQAQSQLKALKVASFNQYSPQQIATAQASGGGQNYGI